MFRVSMLLIGTMLAGAGPLPVTYCGSLAVEGPLTVKRDRLVRLKATGFPAGSRVIWDVYPDDQADVEERGDTLLMAAPPGRYSVKVRAFPKAGADGDILTCRVVVVVEGDTPAAPPPAAPAAPPAAGKADPAAAIGAIQFGGAGCTATVIGPRRADGRWDIITAGHCVRGLGQQGLMRLKDRRTIRVVVNALDRRADLCWLITEGKVDSLPFANLAAKVPDVGTKVWHAGYGVDRPGNVERGTLTVGENASRQLSFRLSVSHGDSGGGVFDEATGEWLAAVCCTPSERVKYPMWGGSCTRAAELRPR